MQPKDPTIDIYEKHDNCLKCGVSLEDVMGWKYCSARCSKLYLKAQYKKRNRDKINKYNTEYRAKADGAYWFRKSTKERLLKAMPDCQRCGTSEALNMCHVKPHWAGGTNKFHNGFVLCQKCHHAFDEALRLFWGAEEPIVDIAKRVIANS